MDSFKIISPASGELEFSGEVPADIAYDKIAGALPAFVHGHWGYMIFQMIPGSGVSHWDSQYYFHQDITFQGSVDRPIYELHSSTYNHFECSWDGIDLPTEREGQGGFSHVPFVNNTVKFMKGNYRTSDFHFEPRLLEPYANAYEKLYEVMNKAEQKQAADIGMAFNLNKAQRVTLRQIRNPDCPAALRERYIQIKSEEFLITALQQLHQSAKRKPFILTPSLRETAEQIEHILQENLSSPISLGELVKMVGSNMQYIQLAFKGRYGTTINKYQTRLRLEHARSLLLHSPSMSLEDIAIVTGYCDGSRLSNAFYETYGIRPGEFRKQGRISGGR